MTPRTGSLRLLLCALAVAGCSEPPASAADDRTPTAVMLRGTDALSLPPSLTCVSSRLTDGTLPPAIMRVSLTRGADGSFTATLARGPMFLSHDGMAESSPDSPTDRRTLRRADDGPGAAALLA